MIEQSARPAHFTEAEQNARFEAWRFLHKENQITPPEDPIFSEWEKTIPRDNYGEVEVTKAIPAFEKGFKDALGAGTLDQYLANTLTPDLDGVFTVTTTNLTTQAEREIKANHSPESLDVIEGRLHGLLESVAAADMPEAYKEEYSRSIRNKHLQFIKAARGIGKEEFTMCYKSPEQWNEFIDIERSQTEGTVVLRYEDHALEALRLARERRDQTRQDIPVKKALEFWNLSDREKEKIGFDEIGEDELELDNTRSVALFEIALDRMGLIEKGWKVVVRENASAVSSETLPREFRVPSTRKLKGWDVRNTPIHEPYHAVRGENGRVQGFQLLQEESVDDYLKTEEGAAAVAELVFGQKFGDDRQVVFAGRYLAVALALKSRMEEGKIVPQYSMQEIYDKLIEEGMTVTDAKNTVWRTFRGTSMQHKGLLIPVQTDEGMEVVPAAECFVKDAVYFEGQMEVFNWIKENMLVVEGQRRAIVDESLDFSDKLLARIGRASEVKGLDITVDPNAGRYEQLVQKGRMVLISLLDRLGRGKMRLDFLNPGSPWHDLLTSKDTISFAKILEPKV